MNLSSRGRLAVRPEDILHHDRQWRRFAISKYLVVRSLSWKHPPVTAPLVSPPPGNYLTHTPVLRLRNSASRRWESPSGKGQMTFSSCSPTPERQVLTVKTTYVYGMHGG